MPCPHILIQCFLDNSSSDEDACSDVDDDFSVVDDNLLCDSVNFANGPISKPKSKWQRTSEVHFQEQQRVPLAKPVAPPVPAESPTPIMTEVRPAPVAQ